jgi:hypothetical protein
MAIPNVQFFQQTMKTNALGNIELVPPAKNNIIDYSHVHMQIIQDSRISHVTNMVVSASMGKLSGTTLGQDVGSWPLDQSPCKIHSFPVIAPEFSVFITGGPKNTDVGIIAWIMYQ